MAPVSDTVAAYCQSRGLIPATTASEVMDDFATMLHAATQSSDSLLLGVFD